MYRPNRPPRFQPRFPVEKKINKLSSGVAAHKSVIPSGNSGAAVHNKYPPLPSEKGDFQHVLSKVRAVEEDLLDQPKEHGDLLGQLEEAVVESLGAGKEMIAKAVADSWRPQVEDLKEIHGKVLSSQDSATKEATAVRRALAGVYQWRGSSLVTRDKAIVLTGIFLVNNSKKKEQRLQTDLQAFLKANPDFKMTWDEVSFILGRNGVALVDLGQQFDGETTSADFKAFIQELVALPRQLIVNLSDLLFGFFKSRVAVSQDTPKKDLSKDLGEMLVKAGTKYKQEVHSKSKEAEMKCLNPAVDEKVEFKASKAKKVEVQSPHPEEVSRSQVKEEVEVKKLKEEVAKHQAERKRLEEKFQKVTKIGEEARLKLKVSEEMMKNLKSTNEELKKELNVVRQQKEERMFSEKKFIEALSLLFEGGQLVDVKLDDAQTAIVEKVKVLMRGEVKEEEEEAEANIPDSGIPETGKSSSSLGSSSESMDGTTSTGYSDTERVKGESVRVRLFHASGQGLPHRLFTNRGTNLLPVSALQELAPGYKVTALKYRRQGSKNKGWRSASSARLEGGMVHPPPTGWGGKEYVLFTSKFDHHHTQGVSNMSSKSRLPPRTTRQRIRA